jgi:hypothetical protein
MYSSASCLVRPGDPDLDARLLLVGETAQAAAAATSPPGDQQHPQGVPYLGDLLVGHLGHQVCPGASQDVHLRDQPGGSVRHVVG